LEVNGVLEGLSVSGGDETSTSDTSLGGLSLVVLALAGLGSVRISGFTFETRAGNVGESLVRPTTVASVAGGVTINDLLFRERGQSVSVDLVETFSGSDGGESPA
jgi:hypothetical protein